VAPAAPPDGIVAILPRPRQDLPQTRHRLLGLSRRPAPRPPSPRRPVSPRPHPLPRPDSLTNVLPRILLRLLDNSTTHWNHVITMRGWLSHMTPKRAIGVVASGNNVTFASDSGFRRTLGRASQADSQDHIRPHRNRPFVPGRHLEAIRPAIPALTRYFPNLPAVDGCRDIVIAMSNKLPSAMRDSASPQS
jgi:hypothetical protein